MNINFHPLHKKLSIGITNAEMSIEEVASIMEQYSNFIHDIYFSPCEGIKYQSRRRIYDVNKNQSENIEFLESVFSIARSLDIKLNLVLNTRVCTRDQLNIIEKYYLKYKIDILTTFVKTAIEVHKINPSFNIQCSFNQGLDSIERVKEIIEFNVFKTIILGSTLLRDFNTFKLVKNCGLKTKLLVNGGCVHNCSSFCAGGNICKNNFDRKILDYDINFLYAQQSLYPEELYKYYIPTNLIDYIKISSRPISYNEFKKLLDSYVKNESSTYLDESTSNFHLYARLGHLIKFYDNFDRKKIIDYKKQIWRAILNETF